jgi:hypothetical protein
MIESGPKRDFIEPVSRSAVICLSGLDGSLERIMWARTFAAVGTVGAADPSLKTCSAASHEQVRVSSLERSVHQGIKVGTNVRETLTLERAAQLHFACFHRAAFGKVSGQGLRPIAPRRDRGHALKCHLEFVRFGRAIFVFMQDQFGLNAWALRGRFVGHTNCQTGKWQHALRQLEQVHDGFERREHATNPAARITQHFGSDQHVLSSQHRVADAEVNGYSRPIAKFVTAMLEQALQSIHVGQHDECFAGGFDVCVTGDLSNVAAQAWIGQPEERVHLRRRIGRGALCRPEDLLEVSRFERLRFVLANRAVMVKKFQTRVGFHA